MNDDDLLTAAPRTTGRPVTIDPDAVAWIALQLFSPGCGTRSLLRRLSSRTSR
ncbi:hypothetical protein M1D88_17475 [Arthrobacter sp. R1-13]